MTRKGGSTEITLCAEIAGLTNISQSIPPWINEKTAGMLLVNRAYMNLVIQDDEVFPNVIKVNPVLGPHPGGD